MWPYLKNLGHAFFKDEVAFKRWIRALQAAIALTIVSVLSAAGTDTDAIVAEIRTWTPLDYVIRFGVGFLFSSVHSSRKAPTMDEIHAEMSKRGVPSPGEQYDEFSAK